MKNEKRKMNKPFLALLFVICYLLFVFGCGNFLNPPKKGNTAVPAGMGTFSLQINSGQQSRVIMPDTAAVEFAGYTLEFTNTATTNVQNIYLSEANKEDPVILAVGTYTLEVTAYTSYTDETDNEIAAEGAPDGPVEIIAGENVSATVILQAIIGGEGEGTFSWEIGFPGGLSEASMEITPQAGTVFTPQTKYFIGSGSLVANPGSIALPSGHYRVVFTLEKDNNRTVTWRETLHVYQNLDSHFEYDFTDYHFIKQYYTITLTNLYTPAGDPRPNEISTYFFDDSFVIAAPSRPSYLFGGWLIDDAFGSPWDSTFDSDLILYAKWLEIPMLALDPPLVNFIMAKDSLTLPDPVTVTVTNTGTAAATVTSILLSGTNDNYFSLSGENLISSIAAGSSDTFDVNVILTLPASVATYRAVVTVTYSGSDGVKTVSANITFAVTDFYGIMPASQMILDSRNMVTFSGEGDQYGRYMLEVEGIWVEGEMIPGEAKIELTYGATETVQNNASMQDIKPLSTVGNFKLTDLSGSGNPRHYRFDFIDLNIQHSAVKVIITLGSGNLWIDNNGTQGAQVTSIEINSYVGYCWMSQNANNIKFDFEITSNGGWVYNSVTSNPYPIFRQNGVTIYYWRFDGTSGEGPGMWSWGDTYFTKYETKAPGTPDTIIFHTNNIYAPGVFFVPGLGGTDLLPGNVDYSVPPVLGSQVFNLSIGDAFIGTAVVTVTSANGPNVSVDGTVDSVNISVEYNFDSVFLPLVQSYTCNITDVTQTWNSASPTSHVFTFNNRPYGAMVVNTVVTFK